LIYIYKKHGKHLTVILISHKLTICSWEKIQNKYQYPTTFNILHCSIPLKHQFMHIRTCTSNTCTRTFNILKCSCFHPNMLHFHWDVRTKPPMCRHYMLLHVLMSLQCIKFRKKKKIWARDKKREIMKTMKCEGRDCKRVKRSERQWINNRDCDVIVSVIY
jgi:hypothetical protein